jgi:hypothetical protein
MSIRVGGASTGVIGFLAFENEALVKALAEFIEGHF